MKLKSQYSISTEAAGIIRADLEAELLKAFTTHFPVWSALKETFMAVREDDVRALAKSMGYLMRVSSGLSRWSISLYSMENRPPRSPVFLATEKTRKAAFEKTLTFMLELKG